MCFPVFTDLRAWNAAHGEGAGLTGPSHQCLAQVAGPVWEWIPWAWYGLRGGQCACSLQQDGILKSSDQQYGPAQPMCSPQAGFLQSEEELKE